MALRDILKSEKPSNILEVLIIKRINALNFIVGDSSSIALLNLKENPQHEKYLKIGKTMNLLKPIVIDRETLQTNKNFKPFTSKNTI